MYHDPPRRRILEDDPRFNPYTMGNRRVGPIRGPRRQQTADRRGTLARLLLEGRQRWNRS